MMSESIPVDLEKINGITLRFSDGTDLSFHTDIPDSSGRVIQRFTVSDAWVSCTLGTEENKVIQLWSIHRIQEIIITPKAYTQGKVGM